MPEINEQQEKELQQGSEAQQLLNNPVFRAVMDRIRDDLEKTVYQADTTDKDLCADIIQRKQIFASIEGMLKNYVQTGKMAQLTMEQQAEQGPPEFKR